MIMVNPFNTVSIHERVARILRHLTVSMRPRRRAGRRNDDGFTLVEVIIVLSIIGLIMSMVGPRVLGYLTDSKAKTAKIQVETLASAVELFFIDNGRYPLESEGLQALVSRPTTLRTWNGPYIKGATVPSDPWGRPYRYASPDRGRTFTITFSGPEEAKEPRRLSSAARL
jgi:general secretion pathway protein G